MLSWGIWGCWWMLHPKAIAVDEKFRFLNSYHFTVKQYRVNLMFRTAGNNHRVQQSCQFDQTKLTCSSLNTSWPALLDTYFLLPVEQSIVQTSNMLHCAHASTDPIIFCASFHVRKGHPAAPSLRSTQTLTGWHSLSVPDLPKKTFDLNIVDEGEFTV